MPVSELYTLHVVQIGTTSIPGITNQSIDPKIQELLAGDSGVAHNLFAGFNNADPLIGFTSTSLKQALDALGARGKYLSGATTAILFGKGYELGAERLTTGTKAEVGKGLAFPRTLTADHLQFANLASEILPLSTDGWTDPITVTAAQALSGDLTAEVDRWTLGRLVIDDVEITQLQSASVDFGCKEILRGCNSEFFRTFGALELNAPVISIRSTDLNLLADFGQQGYAITDEVILHLRKYAEGGAREGDGEAVHISFSMSKGIVKAGPVQGGSGGQQEAQLSIFGVYTPGVTPVESLVINTATTIPALVP